MSRDESKNSITDLKAQEAVGNEATHDWSKFKPSCLFSCCNFVLQLVLVGSLGSFLFGFNMALLNTATKSINSSFLQCSEPDFYLRFTYRPSEFCKEYDYCAAKCDVSGPLAICPGGWSSFFSGITADECAEHPACIQYCAVYDAERKIVNVRCPGGYNDIGCPSLKWYNAFLATSVLVGATIGSLTGGNFLVFGRRTVLLVTMCIFLIGIVSCTVSNSFSALIWGRIVVGYAIGLVSVASPTYMSEVTPSSKRGSYGVMHQLMIVVGIFLPMLLGLPLVDPAAQDDLWRPSMFQEFWWRFMLATGILPTLLALYLLLCVYTFDTPVYYVEQRRFKDAAALLELIHGKQDIHEELESVIQNVREGELSKRNGMTFGVALKNPEYRHVIIVGIVLAAFQQFGGINVFMTSSSDIFRKAGLSGTMQIGMSVIMGAINIVMTFPTLYLIERMGRKSLMFIGSLLQFISVVPAAIMYWINPDSPITQILAIIAVLGFVTFFAVAYGPVLWVYLFEIYPMEIKDVAAGVATAVNWVAGVIMVFVTGLLDNRESYTLFAGLQLVGTILIFFLMRETKGLALGDSPFITKKNNV